ncbi:MAG: Nif3-like dinuclear metal center hexameric protein [Coriobacteriia bacterium]|nr:Nif3-like dinuclear metal center hexameric protein [Coriobacteriia bacterium]
MALTVGQIEAKLFDAFPSYDAEDWDKVGLSVGRRSQEVHKIALALDVTTDAIRKAQQFGAELLLTHHPIFLSAPHSFEPLEEGGLSPASSLYEAARLGVSVISMHTNLDRSKTAARLMPEMLDLEFIDQYEKRFANKGERELGRLGALSRAKNDALTLEMLAKKAKQSFGRVLSVWGDPHTKVRNVLSSSGSLSDMGFEAFMRKDVDTIVTGELSYHKALDLSIQGLNLILLGHDVSELPYTKILFDIVRTMNFDSSQILTIQQDKNWWSL